MRFKFPKWHIRRSIKLCGMVLGLLSIIAFTGKRNAMRTCSKIHVTIANDELNHFVDENDVVQLIDDTTTIPVTGKPLSELSTRALENRLKRNSPYIEDVQISNTLNGDLLVKLKQVTPIARFIGRFGKDYYLCDNKTLVPVSRKFTARVMVIDGSTEQLERPDTASQSKLLGFGAVVGVLGKLNVNIIIIEQRCL